jgi:glycosyltransferase involved in cell wall biosynthesis
MNCPLRILIVGHMVSGEATGEGFVAFRLAEALAELADVTLATLQSPRHTPLARQLPNARVVTFPQPQFLLRPRQFRELVKPDLLVYAHHLRRFLKNEAGAFDIAHQLMPAALRHASPLRGLGLPYVLGPFGGTLPTPAAFRTETESSGPWYARLRDLDGVRLRHDPRLRASISEAALVLGVASYIRDILDRARLSPRRYADFMKLGIPDLPPDQPPRRRTAADPLRLVHVGRGIRTKALRDVIRALGHLKEDRRFTLESAGGGPEIALCRAEAEALGIADRVTFHDRLPRAEVETLYQRADAFVFPSFREPAGAVFFEAMRWGLPVIAARAGGAEAIIDESCGIRIEVTDPDRFPRDISTELVRLADDPGLYARLSDGARLRVADALWPNRAAQLLALYRATFDEFG